MIFVGYESGTKGYRFWDPSTQSIVVARDVTFNENSFPKRDQGSTPKILEAYPPAQPKPIPDNDPEILSPEDIPLNQPPPPPVHDEPEQDGDDDDLYADPQPQPPADEPHFVMGPPPPRQEYYRPPSPLPKPRRNTPRNLDERRQVKEWIDQRYPVQPPALQPVPPAPRPRRENAGQRHVPDNVYGDVPATEAWRRQEQQICQDRREEAAARSSPLEKDVDDDQPMDIDSNRWINYFVRHAATSDLLTYREAMSRPDAKQWEIAMKEEIKSQMENDTWTLVARPNNR